MARVDVIFELGEHSLLLVSLAVVDGHARAGGDGIIVGRYGAKINMRNRSSLLNNSGMLELPPVPSCKGEDEEKK